MSKKSVPTNPTPDRQAPMTGKSDNDFNKVGKQHPTQKNEGRRTPASRHDRESHIGNNQSKVRRGGPESGKTSGPNSSIH